MNHTDPRPLDEPVLKLPRRIHPSADVSNFGTTRTELAAELDSLRERETNLRAYEERLRAWQAQLDVQSGCAPMPNLSNAPFVRPTSRSPFSRDPALEAAWEKLHRARALLEAEQRQMCDDRLKLRDATAAVQQREAELAEREARHAAWEQQRAAATAAAVESDEKPAAPASWSLTQAPFRAAKAIFRTGT